MKKLLILWALTCLFTACEDSGMACQNPPPSISFKINSGDSSQNYTRDNLRITYLRKTGVKAEVTDLRYDNGIFNTYDLIIQANELGNNSIFTLESDGVKLKELTLKTYKDNSRCDGWIHASEIKAGNKVLEIDKTSFAYIINLAD
ncbi:hypothetical protein GVN16_20080 [Emticicia sp. CRIBPO]|uniref:hypothetical protein n=1 Tax=Emticicia sp. CRIBPO TaxID=2683258 RepID=UPI0014136B35|nr:hypothetical protein [Emticicia sp. CRIBPO]NBA88081.1 hypothetical protein [Emticicia sp. CRIBPO]